MCTVSPTSVMLYSDSGFWIDSRKGSVCCSAEGKGVVWTAESVTAEGNSPCYRVVKFKVFGITFIIYSNKSWALSGAQNSDFPQWKSALNRYWTIPKMIPTFASISRNNTSASTQNRIHIEIWNAFYLAYLVAYISFFSMVPLLAAFLYLDEIRRIHQHQDQQKFCLLMNPWPPIQLRILLFHTLNGE